MQKLFLFLIIIIIAHVGVSQKNADIGFMVGTSTYMGDLNTETPFRKFGPGIKAFYRRNLHTRLAIRGDLSYARIMGDDAKSDFDYQLLRNNNFQSDILEGAVLFELNFLRFEMSPRTQYISPYIFGGLGMMLLDFQITNNIGEYFTIPFGMGVKIGLNSKWAIGVEYSLHKTFRDDLDKISEWLYTSGESYPLKQRANAQNDDWFTFFGVFLSYKLKDCVTCPANL